METQAGESAALDPRAGKVDPEAIEQGDQAANKDRVESALFRPGLVYGLAFASLQLLLLLPSQLFSGGLDDLFAGRAVRVLFSYAWISVEVVFVTVCFTVWPGVSRSVWARITCSFFIAFVLVFEAYDVFVLETFHRPAVLYDDVLLLPGVFHLLSDLSGAFGVYVFMGVFAFGAIIFWAIPRAVHAMSQSARCISLQPRRAIAMGAALIVTVSFFDASPARRDCLAQSTLARLAVNLAASVEARAVLANLGNEDSGPMASEALAPVRLEHAPNIYLLVIESYGAIALEDPEIRTALAPAMNAMSARLEGAAFESWSHYSESPVAGGTSWLAAATLLGGVRIDHQHLHRRFVRDGVFAMPSFFASQGYSTLSLAPGTRARPDLPISNPYGFDLQLTQNDLEYEGPSYGWGIVPDAWSLERARRHLVPPGPWFMYFATVSTHAPWNRVPPLDNDVEPMPAPPKVGAIERFWAKMTTRVEGEPPLDAVQYAGALRYDLEVLSRFLVNDAPRPAIAILIGDHQPPMIAGVSDRRVPLHVLTEDAELGRILANHGFARGLKPAAVQPLQHEALFSLLVRVLALRYSDSAAAVPEVQPLGFSRKMLGG